MKKDWKSLFLLCGLCLVLPWTAWCDFESAQAAYLRGLQKEKKHDYSAALSEYQASLAAEPRYFWAYKRSAACRYRLGDKSAALKDYETYLAANPIDAEAGQYAAGLKAALARERSGVASPPAPRVLPVRFWGLGLSAGYDTYAMADFNATVPTGPSYSGGTIGGGLHAGLDVRCRLHPNWAAGFSLNYLTASSTLNTSSPASNITDNINFPCLTYGPLIEFILPSSHGLEWQAGLECDLMSLSMASDSASGTVYSALGLGTRVFGGLEWFFADTFSLNAGLGWRLATLSPVSASNGGGTTTLRNRDGSNLKLDYSGLCSSIGLVYWL